MRKGEKDGEFSGSKEKRTSLLGKLEKRLVDSNVSKIPKSIETYHLTLMTVVWCFLIVVFSYLARSDIRWLWGTSAMIVMQYLTDIFDGAVGRHRNTGLVKWGYYMDHFLDYFFMCSVMIGYMLIASPRYDMLIFFILAIFGGFMVNSYLAYSCTQDFRNDYLGIGGTEIRLIFIIVNTLLIIFGKTYMGWILPYLLIAATFGLAVVVYHTQDEIWDIDMKNKKKDGKAGERPSIKKQG